MSKFYSFPPKELSMENIKCFEPISIDRGGKGNLVVNPDGSVSGVGEMRSAISADDLVITDLGSVKDVLKDLAMKVDILMEAIDTAHMIGLDGKCREDCWSCKILETIEGIKVARKLRGPE